MLDANCEGKYLRKPSIIKILILHSYSYKLTYIKYLSTGVGYFQSSY